jgi:hypothetical protein
MRRLAALLLALLIYAGLHEGTHALAARAFGEYDSFRVRAFGLEVVMKTPVEQREGAHWAVISGGANLVTVLLGYGMLALRRQLAAARTWAVRVGSYWLALVLLWGDPLNISLGAFVYGGDAEGIAVGLSVPRYVVQLLFFLLFLVNRELFARKMVPLYGVLKPHPLLRPWFG